MATSANPKNTYNPRGDAAKLLSYRPNGAVITDDDGAFLAVRPIILNLSSFDKAGNFVADDHTIAYLRKIESDVVAIISKSCSIEDDQKSFDFMNDAIMARVAPLVERLRFAVFATEGYVSETAILFIKSVDETGTGEVRLHVIIKPRNSRIDFHAEGIDLTDMVKYTASVN